MAAAKQGLSAHLSQASEDAKRMTLNKLPSSLKSHPFLSNLNTTCTIKSAPGRTPDILTKLATKSGWLYKRNEQHVWQKRYCCVVPHTFLYYFDAAPTSNEYSEDYDDDDDGGYKLDVIDVYSSVNHNNMNSNHTQTTPTRNNTTDNNYNYTSSSTATAITNKKHINQRNPSISTTNTQTTAINNNDYSGTKTTYTLAPVGIIDLECYSSVRNPNNIPGCDDINIDSNCIMELSPDTKVNPDLRSFYFQANNQDDVIDWTHALLHDRFYHLKDEVVAYEQICQSFPIQLKNMDSLIAEADQAKLETQNKLYTLQNKLAQMENKLRMSLEELCERHELDSLFNDNSSNNNHHPHHHHSSSAEFVNDACWETLQSKVNLLQQEKAELSGQIQSLKDQLNSQNSSEIEIMRKKLQQQTVEHTKESQNLNERLMNLEKLLAESRAESSNLNRQLEAQAMEFGIHKASSKSKLNELQSHKKILKNEVLELRKQVQNSQSQLTKSSLEKEKLKLELISLRDKNEWKDQQLKTYSKNMDNLMETMSLGSFHVGTSDAASAAGGSRYVNTNGSLPPLPAGGKGAENHYHNHHERNNSHDDSYNDNDNDDDHSQSSDTSEQSEFSRGNMSELTEDRTHYTSTFSRASAPPPQSITGSSVTKVHQFTASNNTAGSSSDITKTVKDDTTPRQNTTTSSMRYTTARDENHSRRVEEEEESELVIQPLVQKDSAEGAACSDILKSGLIANASSDDTDTVNNNNNVSMMSTASSVAQRSKLEANMSPNRMTLTVSSSVKNKQNSSVRNMRGLLSKLSDAIDQSPLGVGIGTTNVNNNNNSDGASVSSKLSLQERQKLQRERQKEFLKTQGLRFNGAAPDTSGDISVSSTASRK